MVGGGAGKAHFCASVERWVLRLSGMEQMPPKPVTR